MKTSHNTEASGHFHFLFPKYIAVIRYNCLAPPLNKLRRGINMNLYSVSPIIDKQPHNEGCEVLSACLSDCASVCLTNVAKSNIWHLEKTLRVSWPCVCVCVCVCVRACVCVCQVGEDSMGVSWTLGSDEGDSRVCLHVRACVCDERRSVIVNVCAMLWHVAYDSLWSHCD